MKKILLVILAVLMVASSAFARSDSLVTATAGISIGMGDNNKFYVDSSFFEVKGKYCFQNYCFVYGQVGYRSSLDFEKDETGFYGNASLDFVNENGLVGSFIGYRLVDEDNNIYEKGWYVGTDFNYSLTDTAEVDGIVDFGITKINDKFAFKNIKALADVCFKNATVLGGKADFTESVGYYYSRSNNPDLNGIKLSSAVSYDIDSIEELVAKVEADAWLTILNKKVVDTIYTGLIGADVAKMSTFAFRGDISTSHSMKGTLEKNFFLANAVFKNKEVKSISMVKLHKENNSIGLIDADSKTELNIKVNETDFTFDVFYINKEDNTISENGLFIASRVDYKFGDFGIFDNATLHAALGVDFHKKAGKVLTNLSADLGGTITPVFDFEIVHVLPCFSGSSFFYIINQTGETPILFNFGTAVLDSMV